MKKFSDFKKFKKIYEQEITLSTSVEEVSATQSQSQAEPEIKSEEPQSNPETNPETEKSDVSKFFSKLFESREMAHVYHLQIRGEGSYAGHKALDEYYTSVLDLIDQIIETYSGQYEIVENYETIDTSNAIDKNKVDYFTELQKFIKENRYSTLSKEDTHLQNIVDEIVALGYRTLYKLKNLQ